MFWSIVTVIVAALIIIAFLIPAIAGIIFVVEIVNYVSKARHERFKAAAPVRISHSAREASGPFCPWEARRIGHAR